MYESEPQEGGNPCMWDGRVIRKDYELMHMYHFSSGKSCGAGSGVSSLVLSLLHPLGISP